MPRRKNDNLKSSHTITNYTPEQVSELRKCLQDSIYFIENYVYIKSKKGMVLFKLYDYQKRMIRRYQKNDYCVVLRSRQVGKCLSLNEKIKIVDKKTKKITELSGNELYRWLCFVRESKESLSSVEDGKFVDIIDLNELGLNLEIESDSGFVPLTHFNLTKKFTIWTVYIEDVGAFECADTHILFDENLNEIFVKDLVEGKSRIYTKFGPKAILKVVENSGRSENMFDLTVDSIDHRFFDVKGILSHNTETTCAYILWYALFNDNKTVLIASNRGENAKENIDKIQYAYEALPNWLKPGIKEDTWNKHTCKFENNSRILATTTSENSGRGLTINLLYLDEFAHVRPHIQHAFWTSISPTLARTEGSCIMSSTPNGDSDLFANLWRGSESGTNLFYPIRVKWNEPPGRDEKFKEEQISIIGPQKFAQEFLCDFLSKDDALVDPYIVAQAEKNVKEPLFFIENVPFWKQINQQTSYLVAVDPAQGVERDYSVIEVFSFPDLEQVMEFRSNLDSPHLLYSQLKNVLNYLERNSKEVLFSIESNGVGAALISLYEADETPPEKSYFVSESGKNRYGFSSTNPTRIKALIMLKELLESGSIKINSRMLLSELKTLVKKGNKFEAQSGSTDDCIFATLIIIRIVEEMSSYNSQAYTKMYAIEHNKKETGWNKDEKEEFESNPEDEIIYPFIIG